MTTTIGFIGLGVMGQSMANHLLEASYDVVVYNRTKSKAHNLVAQGAQWVDSPAEVARNAEIVLTILGYPQDVDTVYRGENGLFAGRQENSVFVDMTTSSPTLARTLYDEGRELGVSIVDAPVSGGDIGAKSGRLTTMVGGDQSTYDRLEGIFKTFSHSVQLYGPAGAGQSTKVANQIMIAGTMVSMSEALVYAKAAGLDAEAVIKTLSSGAAGNWSLENYGPRILKQDYSAGFFVKHFIKDLGIALEEAERLELKLPGVELAHRLYEKLSDHGYADNGTQALIKLWWD